MSRPVRVLFVCLGNFCRSPMAEAIFWHQAHERGLASQLDVASCGLGDWHLGQSPHEGTRRVLDAQCIPWDELRSKMMDLETILGFDFILAMDASNVEGLIDLGVPPNRIQRLTDFIPGQEGTNVPDPFFHGNFEGVYALIESGVRGLIDHIVAERRLHG